MAGVERTDYAPKGSLADDLRVLKAMWFGNIKGGSHQDQLESFYNKQVWTRAKTASRSRAAALPWFLLFDFASTDVFRSRDPLRFPAAVCASFPYRRTCTISIDTECSTAGSPL